MAFVHARFVAVLDAAGWSDPDVHFAVLTPAAGLCLVGALVVLVVGWRRRLAELAILGLSLSVLSLWAVAEALAAPGYLSSGGQAARLSMALALPASMAAGLPLVARRTRLGDALARRWRGWIVVCLAGSGAAFVCVLATDPSMAALDPVPMSALPYIGASGALVLAWRQVSLFRVGRRTANVVAAAALVALALTAIVGSRALVYDRVWWAVHLVDVLAVFAASAGLIVIGWKEAALASTLRPVVNDDPLLALELGLRPVVHAFVAALERKDAITRDHVVRVAELAMRVAERSGLSPTQQRRVGLGALMHDVGKLVIPSEVLTKPGALTDEEFECIRTHAAQGAALLEMEPELAPVAPIVRAHHERVDGSGYPEGLVGDAIPVEASIVSVCDAWDAMTNARHYRGALDHERARSVIEAGAGTQWDVAACHRLLEVISETLPSTAFADVGRGLPLERVLAGGDLVCDDAVPAELVAIDRAVS